MPVWLKVFCLLFLFLLFSLFCFFFFVFLLRTVLSNVDRYGLSKLYIYENVSPDYGSLLMHVERTFELSMTHWAIKSLDCEVVDGYYDIYIYIYSFWYNDDMYWRSGIFLQLWRIHPLWRTFLEIKVNGRKKKKPRHSRWISNLKKTNLSKSFQTLLKIAKVNLQPSR